MKVGSSGLPKSLDHKAVTEHAVACEYLAGVIEAESREARKVAKPADTAEHLKEEAESEPRLKLEQEERASGTGIRYLTWLDGKRYIITKSGHELLTNMLAEKGSFYVSDRRRHTEDRSDRTVKKLPQALRDVIESKSGSGGGVSPICTRF